MSLSYIWPIALVVISNTVYQICAKSCPEGIDPLASLTVTYLVGAAVSLGLYFILEKEPDLFAEYRKLNWAPVVLGVVIVGLEVGYIFAFRAGWQVSSAQLVQSAVLAVILLIVGLLLYGEKITWTKAFGTVICLIGLYFINK